MIRVHGYLGTITDAMRDDVAHADLVVGGQRHLDALDVPDDKRQKLGLIGPAVERIQSLPDDARVVVIASGVLVIGLADNCLLYTSPSPRDRG